MKCSAVHSSLPGRQLTNQQYSAIFVSTMLRICQKRKRVNLQGFFSLHPVFTVDEINVYLAEHGSCSPNTRKALLAYHCGTGRIVNIRRGLYATVPYGANPETFPVDPFLIAAKITEDAVLAYHTALEFHGKAYSLFSKHFCLSARRSVSLKFRSCEIRCVEFPSSLAENGRTMFGTSLRNRAGIDIRVTDYERTLVDVLDRPDLSGGWEEIWRSLESVEYFDLEKIIEYVRYLDNTTTAAKVGFFLEQHKESLMVQENHLDALRCFLPHQPHYMNRDNRKGCKWVKNWNLMVPVEIINKSWEDEF